MQAYNDYLDLVNQEIAAIPYPEQPEQLYAPIHYTMSQPGKRLRPVLALMACEAAGGDIAKAIKPAVGLELFHNFTLLHDDVMDRADVRRGEPTVHRKWNDNVAILSGDAMLTLATQYMCSVPAKHLPQVMELFNRTAMEIYEGQQWDMDFENRHDVKQDEYVEMIRLKTSVLLGCACQLGAIMADAPEQQAQALYDMGMNLGLAFQLQDDALDVWGDESSFGKAIGGDIACNKKTFLLINAMQRATGDDQLELCRWLNDPEAIRSEKVKAVTALYERLGLRQLSDQAIAQYNARAIDALQRANLPEEAHDQFVALINRLVTRNS